MRTTSQSAALAATLVSLLLAAPGGAQARTYCVGGGAGCDATIQRAIDHARDGDVVRVGAGRFDGGLQIDRSIRLAGAGAGSTVITGGEHVITVGRVGMATPPTVTISGVTVTGGDATSSPISADFTGSEHVIATGGGIEIPPPKEGSPGATVTIADSVVTGNRARPTEDRPFGPTCPGGDPCPFAWARGGGINTWGKLTLLRTTVSNNEASGLASDAHGGGIMVWQTGALTMQDSAVDGNRAIAVAPNGRFAEGGGVFTEPGTRVTVNGGSVSGNRVRLTSHLPYLVDGADPLDLNANGGGLHVGDDTPVTITGTHLDGNVIDLDNPEGEAYAFDAAMNPGSGPTVLQQVTVTGNAINAHVGSSQHVGASGAAIDLHAAKVSDTAIVGNTARVWSDGGDAETSGTLYVSDTNGAVLDRVRIANNTVRASSDGGPASVWGAGLVNDAVLRITDSVIAGNRGQASGAGGVARGGGIFNDELFESGAHKLTLRNTTVSQNRLTGSAGIAVAGGGIYTASPISAFNSPVSGNAPDDCSGC